MALSLTGEGGLYKVAKHIPILTHLISMDHHPLELSDVLTTMREFIIEFIECNKSSQNNNIPKELDRSYQMGSLAKI